MLQTLIHYSLHLLFPGLLAWVFFRDHWKRAWLVMLATMLVDLDHIYACKTFLATNSWWHFLDCPDLFVADRCSIGFHPLHTRWAMGAYALMLFIPKVRIAGIGLLWHMITDWQDCLWMPP